jgi:hypothetical protein
MSSASIELVAVQPFMRVDDYLDAAAFAATVGAQGSPGALVSEATWRAFQAEVTEQLCDDE